MAVTPQPPSGDVYQPDAAAVAAIAAHMNRDHADDAVTIVRGLTGRHDVHRARVTGLDAHGIDFACQGDAGTVHVRLGWSAPLAHRGQVRDEVVAMHRRACAELGLDPGEPA